MILINLLPKDLRKKERKIVVPYMNYLAMLLGVVILFHVVLFSLQGIKEVQMLVLKAKVSKVSPENKDALSIKKEIVKLESEATSLKGILSRKVVLTDFLSSLSAAVPKGLWMEHFSFTPENLMIQGSVISLNQDEMTIIGKFLQELKNNKTFAAPFSKIELTSVQRRTIKTYDVVDYVLAGELKK